MNGDAGPAAVVLEDGEWLACPGCGGDYLHQAEVRVVVRDREDGEGTVVRVDGSAICSTDRPGVEVSRVPNERLRGRRDSLAIRFECENGCAAREFVVMQHKGRTRMEWV